MSIPKTTASWFVTGTGEKGFDNLELRESITIPELSDYECLVQIEAVSLNYRDLIIPKDEYPFPVELPRVPCCDSAGTVLAVGKSVSRFSVGDKVCTILSQLHQFGPITPAALASGLGASLDGTLRQHGVFPETGLVPSPINLTPIAASTLSCTYVTAWNALFGLVSKALKPGDVVLTQGTGGVSLSAIQFAVAAGATVIATTSSTAKAAKLKSLGVHHVINYTTDPDWGTTAKNLTPNHVGVSHILEVGGTNTMAQSLAAVRYEGVISIIGFLGRHDKPTTQQPTMLDAWANGCIVRGILIGSRAQFEEMNAAIEAKDIQPVVDERVFSFHEAREAFAHHWNQKNFGKVVIRMQ